MISEVDRRGADREAELRGIATSVRQERRATSRVVKDERVVAEPWRVPDIRGHSRDVPSGLSIRIDAERDARRDVGTRAEVDRAAAVAHAQALGITVGRQAGDVVADLLRI